MPSALTVRLLLFVWGLGGSIAGAAVARAGPPPAIEEGPVVAVGPSASSRFQGGTDGWTSSDGPHALRAEGGRLLVSDLSESWHWIAAPVAFRGDWSDVAAIELRVRPSSDSPLPHPAIVSIEGPAGRATHEVHPRFLKAGAWRRIQVPVAAASWEVHGRWRDLVRHVTSLRLRLDLDSRTDAMEVHAIDDVRLTFAPASTFARGDDGWRVEGGAPVEGTGSLRVRDVDDGWSWVRAPQKFHGDWRGHRELVLRVRPDRRFDLEQPLRVQVEGADGMAIYQVAASDLRPGRWTLVRVPLDGSRWAVSGSWERILRRVGDLWIRVDLAAAPVGEEVVEVDDVRLR